MKRKNVYVDRRITRSMSLKTGNEDSLPIPIDVTIMIFAKLPLKSIARCRCVSKLWASILRRSDFTELFLTRSCSRTPKLLFTFHNESEIIFFSSPQPQNPDENYQMKFSFCNDWENNNLVRGLICLEDLRHLKVCNPSTGETLVLSKLTKHRHDICWRLFGYDPIGKQFKVLVMAKSWIHGVLCDEYKVLTLGGSGKMSWKRIECCIPHNLPWRKICINGVIYYTPINWLIKTYLIVCFDVRFEKFSFIEPTGMINFLETTGLINRAILFDETTVNPINYNGKLGLLLCEEDLRFVFFDGGSISFKLWVLEDFEKQEWSEHTFLFPTVPENIVGKVILNFVGMTQTNEIVLSSCYKHYPFYLFYLNLEKKTIVRVTIQGIEAFMEKHNGIHRIFLDHVEDVKLYGKCLGT